MAILMNGIEVNHFIIDGEVFSKPHIASSAADAIKYSNEHVNVPVLYSFPE